MYVMMKWSLALAMITLSSFAGAQTVTGVLRVVKGDVQIKSAKTGQTTRARIGAQVNPKDVIITGKDARAKIVMVDKNEINISPESNIEIQNYEFDPAKGKKDVLLNVIYGKVRAKVEQKYDGKTTKFQIKTPAAVAGVRGTDFITSYDRSNNSSRVITFRGRVEFGTPGPGGTIRNPVSVTPGKMAASVAGAAPSAPVSVPKEQLASMDSESKAEVGPLPGERAPSGDSEKSDKKEDGKKDDAKKDEPKKEEAKKEDVKKDEPKKQESQNSDGKKSGAAAGAPAADAGGGTKDQANAPANSGGGREPANAPGGGSTAGAPSGCPCRCRAR